MNIPRYRYRTRTDPFERIRMARACPFALIPSPGRERRGNTRARSLVRSREIGPPLGPCARDAREPLHFQNGTPNCISHMYTRVRAQRRSPVGQPPHTDHRTTAADELAAAIDQKSIDASLCIPLYTSVLCVSPIVPSRSTSNRGPISLCVRYKRLVTNREFFEYVTILNCVSIR